MVNIKLQRYSDGKWMCALTLPRGMTFQGEPAGDPEAALDSAKLVFAETIIAYVEEVQTLHIVNSSE